MKNLFEPPSEAPSVYVVEASAGSGKTFALAKHYISLLLNKNARPGQIENILAITFTNKAAVEMKERILEILKKMALDRFSTPEEKNSILEGLPDKAGMQKPAGDLMDHILANYNLLQIQTIDSFINRILISCSFRLDISSSFEIKDDHMPLLLYSLDECIDRAGRDKSVRDIFNDFLRQYLYLENKTGWIPKKDILDLINVMYSQKNIYGKNFRKFDLNGENILISKRSLLKLYNDLNGKMTSDINGTFRKVLNNFVLENTDNFDLADIISRKSLLKDELPVLKNKTIPVEAGRIWEDIHKELTRIAEKESASFFNCYIDIFDMVYDIFRSNAQKNDTLFLGELNERAHFLIKKNVIEVPELYYRMATRIRHFLIDEFQDTSFLQWQNFEIMAEEIVSTGGSLFCVGDKKQAIFRFRGGEISLFDEIKNSFREYLKEIYLDTNYRSREEIVKFTNSLFTKENLTRFIGYQQNEKDPLRNFSAMDIDEITGIFHRAEQNHKKGNNYRSGFVRVEAVKITDKDEKYEIIKSKILNLIGRLKSQNRFNPGDIAVLCRENEDVEEVSGWLIDNNIPVESDKTLNIKTNVFIMEIISFLKFLNSPIDNLSFASFIMGNIFLKSSGLKKKQIEDFLFGLREHASVKHDHYFYREFQNVFPDIWENCIEKFYKTVGLSELYEFVTDIFGSFNVFKNFPEQQAFFMQFIQVIKESEEEHNGITDFLEYFEGLNNKSMFINAKDISAVKVMTVHKAKGLGFGTVIIPFLEFDKNAFKSGRKQNISFFDNGPETLSLSRLDKKYSQLSNHLAYLYKEEYKRSFIDELNTLYVSLTRAKNELYVFIPFACKNTSRENEEPKTGNIAKYLLARGVLNHGPVPEQSEDESSPYVYELGRELKYDTAPGNKGSSMTLSLPDHREWAGFLKEDLSDVNLIKNRDKILRGKILHEMLSVIENLEGRDPDEIIRKSVSGAGALFPHVKDYSEFSLIAANLLRNNGLRKFFYVSDGSIHLEKNIVDRFGNTKRIDRLIIKDDEVWIVEYKTKADPALNYKEQIRDYMDLTKELFPEKQVKGFAMFLEEARTEEIR